MELRLIKSLSTLSAVFLFCLLLLNANIGYSSVISSSTNERGMNEPTVLSESTSEVIEFYAAWYGFALEVDNDLLAPYLYNYETSIDGNYYPVCVGQDLDPFLFKYYYRGFAQWDTSGIPDGSDIQSVELTIYLPSAPDSVIGDYVDVYSSDMDIYQMTHRPSDYGRGNPNDNLGQDLFDDAYDGTLYTWQWVDQGDGWVTIDLGWSATQDLESQLSADWFAVGFHEFTEHEDGTGQDRGVSFYGGWSKLTITYVPGSDEYFYSVSYYPFDSDGDGYNDAVEVKMDVDTTDETLYVTVYGDLWDPDQYHADSDSVTWQISGIAVEYGYLYLYVPSDSPVGWYDVQLGLYDEQGNHEDERYDYDAAYLYPPGYGAVGDEYFYSYGVSYNPFDSDGDGYNDAVEVEMDVDTTDGTLYVEVYGYLIDPNGNDVDWDVSTWQISGTAVEYGYLYLYVPSGSPEGYYDVELYLYDDQGNYEDYRYDDDILYYTTEIIFTVYFYSVDIYPVDVGGDGIDDYVEAKMDVDTSDGTIYVTVYGDLYDPNGNYVDSSSSSWWIDGTAIEYGYLDIPVPAGSPIGDYTLYLNLYYQGNWCDDWIDTVYVIPAPIAQAWFYSAWTENSIDNDGDGYYGSVDLCWDADTNLDSQYVYVEIWAYDGGWHFISTYGPYWIYGEEADIVRYTLYGYQLPYTADWDIVLELYDYYTDQFYDDKWLCIPIDTDDQALPPALWGGLINAIETNGYADAVIFGERSDASDGQDAYDVPKPPPGPPPSLYMYFAENLPTPYDKLQEDWKYGSDTYKQWTLKVYWQNAESTTVTLTWAWIHQLTNLEYTSIMLQDPVTGTMVDMLQQNSYQFTMDVGSRELYITCSYRFFITELQAGWNLISSPSAGTVSLNSLQVYWNGVWYTWDEAVANSIVMSYVYGWDGTHYVTVAQLEPGKGYWLYSYEVCELWTETYTPGWGSIADLQTGWDLIGLPYSSSVSLDSIVVYSDEAFYSWNEAVANGIVMPYVYVWDGTRYVTTDHLTPGKGYWIYAYQPCELSIFIILSATAYG